MKYIPDSQETDNPQFEIDYLKRLSEFYTENDELEQFNILHLHPLEPAYPDGFIDARFFRLVAFNAEAKEWRDLGERDGLRFEGPSMLDMVRVFADGSTMLRFRGLVEVGPYQAPTVKPAGSGL